VSDLWVVDPRCDPRDGEAHMVQLQPFASLYQLLSVESSIVPGPDLMQQFLLVSPVANMLVMLQLACGSPLMDTMTIVPTLQEALANTFRSACHTWSAYFTWCYAYSMHSRQDAH